MKSTTACLKAVVLFGIVILSVYALQDEDLVGTWNGKMHIPNFGPYEMTMVIEKTDSGFEGKVSDSIDYIAEDTEIQELKIDGDQLFGWFELTDGSVVSLRLTMDGDIIIGEAERNGGIVSCVFVREK